MGRPSFGPAVSMNSRGRSTNDAAPNTLAEALPGMTEVARFPNRGGYSLLYDAGTDEVVLFNMPVTSPTSGAPPGWRRDDTSPIVSNPDGGTNEKWAPSGMAKKTELIGADSYGSKSPASRPRGTADAAFHERALRLVNAERMRGVNDENRRRYGQPPLSGKPGHGDI